MKEAYPSTVLVVDDEQGVRDYLADVLSFEGYRCECFSESVPALTYLAERDKPADLLLTDIRMPGMNGIELARQIKSHKPNLPVILISAFYEMNMAMDALGAGADDYLRKPIEPGDVVTTVGKYLQEDARRQEEAVREALRDFVAARRGDGEGKEELHAVFRRLGFKRYETLQHSKRVGAYARLLGSHCGLSKTELDHLEIGALLHDIGKIGIPRNVLMKPGSLSEEEWRVMKTHPQIGYRLLSEFPSLIEEAKLVLSHHERFDGNGYPRQISGEEIPIGARIFSIVDAYDAITSDRPYRAAEPSEHALAEISRMSGTQFDPRLVDLFQEIPLQELQTIQKTYADSPVN